MCFRRRPGTIEPVQPDPPSSLGRFTALDWALLLAVGLMWGSSFLLIKVSVADFPPSTVAWLRLAFGAAVLMLVPAARKPLLHRRDWWLVIVLGITWMALPFILFPLAEQTIDSALAGMINGVSPVFTALIAAVWFRVRLNWVAVLGLLSGLLGVLGVAIPSIGGDATLTGILLVLLATLLYGVAFNLSAPLERRNGALRVILRAQLVALVATIPWGVLGLHDSSPTLQGWVSVILLGAISTGLAFACFVILVGRVGAPRASVSVYLVPGVAIVLGSLAAGESIHPLALVGLCLILLGAYLTSRRVG